MKLIYPAIFTPYFDEGGYDVIVPDLPDCLASGDTLADAIEDAVSQASGVILSIMEKGGDVPPASEYTDIHTEDPDDFVSLIVLDMGAYSCLCLIWALIRTRTHRSLCARTLPFRRG